MLQVRRAASPLRTEYFKTLPRDVTRSISVAYTGTIADQRIDAAALDYFDAVRHAFGGLFHYVIKTTGEIEIGRDPRTRTSRTRNFFANTEAIHIGIVGGLNAETGEREQTANEAQEAALEKLFQALADALNTPLEVWDARDHWSRSDQPDDEELDAEREAALDVADGQYLAD